MHHRRSTRDGLINSYTASFISVGLNSFLPLPCTGVAANSKRNNFGNAHFIKIFYK